MDLNQEPVRSAETLLNVILNPLIILQSFKMSKLNEKTIFLNIMKLIRFEL